MLLIQFVNVVLQLQNHLHFYFKINDEMINDLLGGFLKVHQIFLFKSWEVQPSYINLPLVQFQAINERRDQLLSENKEYYVILIFPHDTSS